ncbi:hypothetical protein D9M71_758350 [compost metagenome]
MAAVAALLDDLGVDGLFDFTNLVGHLGLLGQLTGDIMVSAADAILAFAGFAVTGSCGFFRFLLGLVGDGDNFHLARV